MPRLRLALRALFIVFALFAAAFVPDYAAVYVRDSDCKALKPYVVYSSVKDPAEQETLKTRASTSQTWAYRRVDYEVFNPASGAVVATKTYLFTKGVGPFGFLIGSEFAVLNPASTKVNCPYNSKLHFDAYQKELKGELNHE